MSVTQYSCNTRRPTHTISDVCAFSNVKCLASERRGISLKLQNMFHYVTRDCKRLVVQNRVRYSKRGCCDRCIAGLQYTHVGKTTLLLFLLSEKFHSV